MRIASVAFVVLLLVPFTFINAQTTSSETDSSAVISGQVKGPEDKGLPFPSIILYDTTGSHRIAGTAGDSLGHFALTISSGHYLIEISYLSYEPLKRRLRLNSGDEIKLGGIQLSPTTATLDEIVVEGQRPNIEMQFGKRVYNVSSNLTSTGQSALQILADMPSVTTNPEGAVSIRGSQAVRIFINGKPSNMVSNSGDGLRTIPAHLIKKVEVITNPSARYSAEGSAGIINIVLMKRQDRGFNGSLSAGTGYPANHELSANLNYRQDKVNWFANVSGRYENEPESGFTFQRYNSPDTSYMYRQNQTTQESEKDGDLRLGADIYLPADQTLTASGSVNLERGSEDSEVSYRDMTLSGDLFRRVERDELETENEEDFEFNINYENKFNGSDDHKLTADARLDISDEMEGSDITSVRRSDGEVLRRERTSNLEKSTDGQLRSDYTYSYNENWRFESGIKLGWRQFVNDYTVEQKKNGTWTTLPSFNDNFTYNENVNAAYGIVSFQRDSWSGEVGLRTEHTNVHTRMARSGKATNQSYVDFFPSANLSYEINREQTLQISYTRRLNRPNMWDLLPFLNFSDSRERFTGNPELDPEYSNSYELGYQHRWDGGSAMTTGYYRHQTGVIERITTVENGIRRIMPINMATQKNWGVEVSINQEIGSGLNLRGSANMYRARTSGEHEGQLLNSNSSRFTSRASIQWAFIDGWKAETTARYRGPHDTPQGRQFSSNMVDLALSRTFLDRRGRVTLNVRDLLNSSNFHFVVDEQYLYSENQFSWSTRSFMLNVSYSFNKKLEKRERGRGRY